MPTGPWPSSSQPSSFWPPIATLGLWPQSPALFLGASCGPQQGNPGGPLIPELFPCCGVVLRRQNQVVWGSTWGSPFFLPEGLGDLQQCQTRATVSRARSCSSSPPEHAGSSWLWAFFCLPLGSVSSRDPLLGLWRCFSPGLSSPPHHSHLVEAACLPALAREGPCRRMTGLPAMPVPKRLLPCLGLSLGSLVGFSRGPEPLKSTEVWAGEKKNSVAWRGLTQCAWEIRVGTCCQLLSSCGLLAPDAQRRSGFAWVGLQWRF